MVRPGQGPRPRRSVSAHSLCVDTLEERLTPVTSPWVSLAIPPTTAPASHSADALYSQTSIPVNNPWSDWRDFGISPVDFDVAQNADGRIEAFAVTADGKVYQRWQVKPNGGWAEWKLVGNGIRQLSAARNLDGRLETFAIGTDNALYQRWQLAPNGTWSNWSKVGGSFKSVDAASNKDGRLELFLIGTDSALSQRWQTVAGNGWSAIQKVGGSFLKIRVVQNLDGRMEAFALGTDNALHQRWQTTANGSWSSWLKRDGSFKDLDVGVNLDGRLEIFAVHTSGALYQRWQTAVNGAWSDWKVVGGSLREVEVMRNADGRLQLFAVNTIGRIISRWQVVPGGKFSSWEDMGSGREIIEVGHNQDGRLELFVVNNARRLVHRWQTPVNISPDRDNWNLRALSVESVWSRGVTGRGVIVAVLDTGIDLDHVDLMGNVWTNPGEIPGNGRDDDGNGFVDDIRGWDFAYRDNNPDDRGGHGTHVAGIIAAQANGIGVTGVAPFATVMPVQVLANDGTGSSNDIARGIRYAVDNGANIINISLGGAYNNPTVSDAIQYARGKNVLIVAGAGNEGANSPLYPAAYSKQFPNVLSVGAHDANNMQAGITNKVGTSGAVQVDAPGVDIYSTTVQNGYRFLTGTSMAAPHVSGVAALVLSANPTLTADQLRQILVRSATKTIAYSDSRGGVNAKAAVDLALSSAYL